MWWGLPADRVIMNCVPREHGDHTLALFREGYRFITNRCNRFGSDMFETRLILRRAICMRGPEAAKLFYQGKRVTRVGAMPITVLRLLQDFGSVQLLDGTAHHHRKNMFLTVMAPPAPSQIASMMSDIWSERLPEWQAAGKIILFDELRAILTRSAFDWVGVTLDESEMEERTREFSEMIESTGSIGLRNWRALLLRSRSERWARSIVAGVRGGDISLPADSPLSTIAAHRDSTGALLDEKTAAIEFLNVVRPIVAIARFIVFAAHVLHEHPNASASIRAGDENYIDAFTEEVRRLTPFFAYIGGRVRSAFEWNGRRFSVGEWVILDIFGTNRDPRSWTEPDAFHPERFLSRRHDPFSIIPQGGGDVWESHRCPGEAITRELIKAAVRLLTTGMRYTVPEQDLAVDLSRIPALPKSGFIMTRIQAQ